MFEVRTQPHKQSQDERDREPIVGSLLVFSPCLKSETSSFFVFVTSAATTHIIDSRLPLFISHLAVRPSSQPAIWRTFLKTMARVPPHPRHSRPGTPAQRRHPGP